MLEDFSRPRRTGPLLRYSRSKILGSSRGSRVRTTTRVTTSAALMVAADPHCRVFRSCISPSTIASNNGAYASLRFWRTFDDPYRPLLSGVRPRELLRPPHLTDEARMPGSEHGGSVPGLCSLAGWRDPDAAANLSLFLLLPGVWNGVSSCAQPVSTQAWRPAVGGSACWDPAPCAEVLLRRGSLPAKDLYGALAWHRCPLRTEELPIGRSPEVAHACVRGPGRSATGMPARVAGQPDDSASWASSARRRPACKGTACAWHR